MHKLKTPIDKVEVYIIDYNSVWKCLIYVSNFETRANIFFRGKCYGEWSDSCNEEIIWDSSFYTDDRIIHHLVTEGMIDFLNKNVKEIENIKKYTYICF